MALIDSLASQLSSTFQYDLVGVFTQDYTQVFPTARPSKCIVSEESKLMEHPVESGAVVADHRILLPVEIEINLRIPLQDYKNAYKDIKQFYLNGTFLIVQTKTDSYMNQVIQSIPHEEDADVTNMVNLILKTREVQIVTAKEGVKPRSPKDSGKIKKGNVELDDRTAAQKLAQGAGFKPKI